MTLLVRDAEALLAATIEFHRAQGVDFFIVTDNASADRTGEIARRYARAGIAEVIDEPGDDYSQSIWVTRMARRAAAGHGADWVINSDDDEFWHAPGGGGLKPVLGAVPDAVAGVLVGRSDHPPLSGQGDDDVVATMIYREQRSVNAMGKPLPPKLCHRADPGIEVAQGNARARRGGRAIAAALHPDLRIEHFPVRGYASFERKIRAGGAAYARNTILAPSVGQTWRDLYALWQEGGLRAWYDRRTLDPAALAAGLADGSLVREDVVHRTLLSATVLTDG